MTEDRPRAKIIISRPVRYAVVAIGVVIGLGIFAWSRKIGPFEERRESPEIIAVLDGGYRTQHAFHAALTLLQKHPVVIAALGEPVTEDGLQRYQPMLQSAGQRFDYVIDLNGPKGEGVATVSVEELAGHYRVTHAAFQDESGKTQDIPTGN